MATACKRAFGVSDQRHPDDLAARCQSYDGKDYYERGSTRVENCRHILRRESETLRGKALNGFLGCYGLENLIAHAAWEMRQEPLAS